VGFPVVDTNTEQREGTAEVLTAELANKVCRSGTHDPCGWTVLTPVFHNADPITPHSRLCVSPGRGCLLSRLTWHLTEYVYVVHAVRTVHTECIGSEPA